MCNKIGYKSTGAAIIAIRRQKKHGASVVRSYICPECGLLHLTSDKLDKLEVASNRRIRKTNRQKKLKASLPYEDPIIDGVRVMREFGNEFNKQFLDAVRVHDCGVDQY